MSHSQRVEGVFLHWRMLEAGLRRKPLTCYETTNCAGLSRGNTSCRGTYSTSALCFLLLAVVEFLRQHEA